MSEILSRKIFLWILLILYSVLIFIFSSRTTVEVRQYFLGQDKVIHFIIYGFHSVLCLLVLSERVLWFKFTRYLFALIFSEFYGVFNEVYQYFIQERECSFVDILANSFGIVTFLALAYIFQNKKLKIVNKSARH